MPQPPDEFEKFLDDMIDEFKKRGYLADVSASLTDRTAIFTVEAAPPPDG